MSKELILTILAFGVYSVYVSVLYRDAVDRLHKLIPLLNIKDREIRKYEKFIERLTKMITKDEIKQFKKDCIARGLKLPSPCTDEWCKEQIKELYEDLGENNEF